MLYTRRHGALIADITPWIRQAVVRADERGYASLRAQAALSMREQLRLYDAPGAIHVAVRRGPDIIWEGRLEDIDIGADSIQLTALGYRRVLGDVTYTALWATSDVAAFVPITDGEMSESSPQRYYFDARNRVYVALQKNAVYANGSDTGAMVLLSPDRQQQVIRYVTFDYAMVLPSNWVFLLTLMNNSFAGGADYTIQTGNGSLQTGSISLDVSAVANEAIAFRVRNNTGSSFTYTGETGQRYLRVTNIRVLATTSSSATARDIVMGLMAYVNAEIPGQLASTSAFIGDPGQALNQEIYEDMRPAEILDRLAGYGDGLTRWQWGVWEHGALHFAPRGLYARRWYVDAGRLRVMRSIADLYTEMYAVYADASGRARRTAVRSDPPAIERYGWRRRSSVRATTTSPTFAELVRDTALADARVARPRVSIEIATLLDGSGSPWPLWACRPGDVIEIRDLPLALAAGADRIRSFRVSETEYDLVSDQLRVTPEEAPPALDVLLARRG